MTPWWPARRSSRSSSAASSSSVIPGRACRAIHSGTCESWSAATRIRSSSQARLDSADASQRGRAVPELEAVESAHVAQVARGRKDVELEPEPSALDTGGGERAGKLAQRSQRLDGRERALLARAGKSLADEEGRLALGRDDEVGALAGAAQVVEVGLLDDERAVQAFLRERGLEARHPPVDLVSRNHPA